MPLHKVARPGDPGIEDVYATAASDRRVAKYRLPEHTSSAQEIYNLVHDEPLPNGNSRRNLATFRTIWAEPEAHRPMDESIDKNVIDKDEYPQTAEIENRCVHNEMTEPKRQFPVAMLLEPNASSRTGIYQIPSSPLRRPIRSRLTQRNQCGDANVTTRNLMAPARSSGGYFLACGLRSDTVATGRVKPAAGGSWPERRLVHRQFRYQQLCHQC
jgi:hypothetical protein